MRSAVVLALVLATGCKEKKASPPPAAKVEPAKPVPAKPQGMPAPCVDYIVAIEKLKKCDAPAKAAVTTQFDGDRDALSGTRPLAREELEALCAERLPAAKRVLDVDCAAPVDVPALKAELAKLDEAIAAEAKLANDASKPDATRNAAKGKVGAAQQQKAALQARIHEAECRADPARPGC